MNKDMKPDYRCYFCATKVFGELIERIDIPSDLKSSFTRDMAELYSSSWCDYSSPEFSRSLHLLLKQYTSNPDPYKKEKKEKITMIMFIKANIRLLFNDL